MKSPFQSEVTPDWEELLSCIQRKGTPRRVYPIELDLDREVREEIIQRYDLEEGLDHSDPAFRMKRVINLQRFLGYDYVYVWPEGMDPFLGSAWIQTQDMAGLERQNGRWFQDETKGPVTDWEEFEKYPWPDPRDITTKALEWYQKNLPDDMCIIGAWVGSIMEPLRGLMGYESLCYALHENRELVQAIVDKLAALNQVALEGLLSFDRVQFVFPFDDMGFRTGPLMSPDDLRHFILTDHRRSARKTHEAGRLYLLHSCGNVELIMEDLIEDIGIDAKHSFEDVILDVKEAKDRYGERIAILGGIDMGFLTRAKPEEVRKRVRETLEHCQAGGGYCLGTGNTVANYIPVDNYLAMLDEGRSFSS
jgi:uroporphyrinogen decarboxylase